MAMESCPLHELKYAIFCRAGRKTKKLPRSKLFLSMAFKGAMSQETGLEVPRCWPQYKRMFLVRAICIDIDSVGALS